MTLVSWRTVPQLRWAAVFLRVPAAAVELQLLAEPPSRRSTAAGRRRVKPAQTRAGRRRPAGETAVGQGGKLCIGTSGWSYPHWRGPFYPRDLPGARQLEFYARHLRSAEINNTFYQLPQAQTLRQWRDTVPRDFVFAVKASRYITHMKKLRDPQASTHRFLQRVGTLGRRLGPILFQLPPRWHLDEQRLAQLLETLPDRHRYAFEFRDRSWHDRRCYRLLERHNAAFCIYELDGFLSPRQVTADFVYVRLHGPDGPYQGSYPTRTLAGWAGACSSWLSTGRDVYCYFDNDQAGYAVQDALRLSRMLNRA